MGSPSNQEVNPDRLVVPKQRQSKAKGRLQIQSWLRTLLPSPDEPIPSIQSPCVYSSILRKTISKEFIVLLIMRLTAGGPATPVRTYGIQPCQTSSSDCALTQANSRSHQTHTPPRV